MNNTAQFLKALQLDQQGDWNGAHSIVQNINSENAYKIHAYLHRKEGDLGNASYWYSKCGEKAPKISLEKEWESLWQKIKVIEG